jgi:hypothetical protein
MVNKKGPKAFDRTLQDLNNNKFILGKVVVILADDFRQTLPIITRGTPADQIDNNNNNNNIYIMYLFNANDPKWLLMIIIIVYY